MKILTYADKNFWKILGRFARPQETSGDVSDIVAKVIDTVRNRGDAAVAEYTKKFDGANLKPSQFRVSKDEFKSAMLRVAPSKRAMMREAVKCVKFFNEHSKPKNWRKKNPHGALVGENFYPIRRVGIYVPGGSAPLVSTVIMTATLAKIAGCKEICVCTPPNSSGEINPYILCALNILGISEVYKVGGAQAIAAMGVGTKTIPAVDKIYGPGNSFVIEAKRQLFGSVGCDLLPGPSEILIAADDSADIKFVAADLLSQAEHGSGREKIYLVTTSKPLSENIGKVLKIMSETLSRAEKLMNIIDKGTFVVLVPDLDAAANVANFIAPEHMEIHVKNPDGFAGKVHTAGAILCGGLTPTVLGDFTAGPSHTLPTGGTGRFSGGLQVADFMRRSSFVKYDKPSIKKAAPVVAAFSEMEHLDAHGNSLLTRLK